MGRVLGRELVVEQSDHSITLSMEQPDSNDRAWDSDLFHRGQLYYAGYSNPIKIEVDHNPEMGDKDTAEAVEGETDIETNAKAEVISSDRYRQFMRQNLISQLLNPRETWQKIVYAVIGLGGLMFINMVLTLWATGSF